MSRIDESRCYKDDKRCKESSDPTENTFTNQYFKDNLPTANSLAIQKGSILMTRKFALIPTVQKSLDKKQRTYSMMTDMFVKITSLKNVYIKKLIEYAKLGHLSDFKGSSKVDARHLYDSLQFTKLDGLPFSKSGNRQFNLKERVKQCTNFEAYEIVRNWLVRNENLKQILDYLISKFENDDEFILTFLAGRRFNSNEIKEIRNILETNCFEQQQRLSNFYLNNHIYQIRNLFLSSLDFQVKFLENPKNTLHRSFSNILLNLHGTPSFMEEIMNSFTRTKKKKIINISKHELFSHLTSLYLRKIKFVTLKRVQRFISLRNKRKKLLEKKQNRSTHVLIKKIERSIDYTKSRLFSIIEPFQFATKNQFIRKRDTQLRDKTDKIQQKVKFLDVNNLYQLVKNAFTKEINTYFHGNNQYVMKSIYKPSFPSIQISNVSFDSLLEYIETKIQYKIRENLKTLFMTKTIKSIFRKGFEYIKKYFYNIVSIPEVKTFSLNLITTETFQESYENLGFKLGFIANKFISFRITDKQNRLKQFIEKFKPANPTITFKHRKLLLNLPFEAKKGSLKPFQDNEISSSNLEMGVDLNLVKHLAVISIWETVNKREAARYFLSWKNILDRKLVEDITWFTNNNGKLVFKNILRWENQARFNNTSHNKPLNIKLKLINLRTQIKTLQRKKNKYEQRLLGRGISDFRSRLKWNKIRRELSLCWNKVHNINTHIVGLVNHFTIQIAKFYNVSKIKVEDLRFAKHSKKSDSGKFMAFWQVHWFFSQVQDAILLQCQLNGITFQKIPARNTSKRCSKCGALGNREGKYFYCAECGLKLDSDLNASRNVVQYEVTVNQMVN